MNGFSANALLNLGRVFLVAGVIAVVVVADWLLGFAIAAVAYGLWLAMCALTIDLVAITDELERQIVEGEARPHSIDDDWG